jgi:hypothetical protein
VQHSAVSQGAAGVALLRPSFLLFALGLDFGLRLPLSSGNIAAMTESNTVKASCLLYTCGRDEVQVGGWVGGLADGDERYVT